MATQHFKTNVLLKSIIGKDLINNDNIAILELVKNGFDAGSKKVSVEFSNILSNDDQSNEDYGSKSSRIVVRDTGSGMSEDDIVHRWLNIAYSEKKLQRTAHGRVMAGSKGIGRFSCDRLGVFLDLYTRRRGSKIVHLKVDWRKFEVEGDPDKLIESVDVEVSQMSDREFSTSSSFDKLERGTILVISRVRSRWDEDKLLSLRRYLERLINPNQSFSKTGFVLSMRATEFSPAVNGLIENMIFKRLDFTVTSIEAKIDENGQTVTTVLRDKGRDIFELVEKNRFVHLRSVKVVIYYLNPYGKGYFKRMTGMDKVQFGSVFLFLNGFRIPPYGDEKDDWLGLDRHKLQGTARFLGTREIVGRVEIDDESGKYKVVSSREGVVQDEGFTELTQRPDGFYFVTHRRLERYVVDGLDWDSAPDEQVREFLQKLGGKSWKFDPKKEVYSESEDRKNFRVLEMLNSVISAKRENIVRLTINPLLLAELENMERERAEEILSNFESLTPEFGRSTTDAMEQLRRAFEKQARKLLQARTRQAELARKLDSSRKENTLLTKENFFLRSSATADDRGVSGLQHQIGISSDSIRRKVRELTRAISQGRTADELMPIVKAISLENGKIHAVSRYATRANFSMVEKSMTKDLVQFLRQYSENVFIELPEHKLAGNRMEVRTTEGKSLEFEAKFSPLELIVVIDNLLDNARKADASVVEMSYRLKGEKSLEIRMRDNGDGVDPRYVARIFDFGFTTSNGGTGIGLFHAKQIMDKLGSIEFVQPEGKGAEFVLTFVK